METLANTLTPTRNITLLKRLKKWVNIEADKPRSEREWLQDFWVTPPTDVTNYGKFPAMHKNEYPCGTAFCVAGYAVVNKLTPAEVIYGSDVFTRIEKNRYPHTRRRDIAVFADNSTEPISPYDGTLPANATRYYFVEAVSMRAMRELGLTMPEADTLFSANNPINTLNAYFNNLIAGKSITGKPIAR